MKSSLHEIGARGFVEASAYNLMKQLSIEETGKNQSPEDNSRSSREMFKLDLVKEEQK